MAGAGKVTVSWLAETGVDLEVQSSIQGVESLVEWRVHCSSLTQGWEECLTRGVTARGLHNLEGCVAEGDRERLKRAGVMSWQFMCTVLRVVALTDPQAGVSVRSVKDVQANASWARVQSFQ